MLFLFDHKIDFVDFLYFMLPNDEKYKKYFSKNIFHQNKQSINLNSNTLISCSLKKLNISKEISKIEWNIDIYVGQ